MLEDYLAYDPQSGDLTWIDRPANCVKVGSKVKSKTSDGYLAVCLKGKQYKAHRVAWFLYHGEWPEDQIDHINRVKTDNRIDNLRCVSHQENQMNKTKGKSGEHYITKYKGRWQVRTPRGGFVGYADTLTEARELKKVFYAEKL